MCSENIPFLFRATFWLPRKLNLNKKPDTEKSCHIYDMTKYGFFDARHTNKQLHLQDWRKRMAGLRLPEN